MKAILCAPKNKTELKLIIDFLEQNKIESIPISDIDKLEDALLLAKMNECDLGKTVPESRIREILER